MFGNYKEGVLVCQAYRLKQIAKNSLVPMPTYTSPTNILATKERIEQLKDYAAVAHPEDLMLRDKINELLK